MKEETKKAVCRILAYIKKILKVPCQLCVPFERKILKVPCQLFVPFERKILKVTLESHLPNQKNKLNKLSILFI